MAKRFDFVSASDKPALLAITTPEWLSTAESALTEIGYKIQKIGTHLEFAGRFSQVPYQVVIIEEQFAGTPLAENMTLDAIQNMPMKQRRHSVIILIGDSFETLNTLQAFQQSVHAVINYSEMALLGQLVQKAVTDNDAFLNNFREIELRIAQAKE